MTAQYAISFRRKHAMTLRMLILFQFLSISLGLDIRAQFSSEERQRFISDLDSARYHIKRIAIAHIIEDSIWEAVPKINQHFWQEHYALQELFLTALLKFREPSVDSLAHLIIDSADILANRPLEIVNASWIRS